MMSNRGRGVKSAEWMALNEECLWKELVEGVKWLVVIESVE